MSTHTGPVRCCRQCGYYLNRNKGSVCSKCFNASLVPVKCKFCGEQTLVHVLNADNENLCVCMKCNWENRSDLKCDTCGNMGKDAMYTSHYYSSYKCKTCCGKRLMKCAECSMEIYAPERVANYPLCLDCRLKNYAPQLCIGCNKPFYFHKFRRPDTCVCNLCYRKRKVE